MELEYFCRPNEAPQIFESLLNDYTEWIKNIGISKDNLYFYEVEPEKLAHYSKRTVDVMYRFFPERSDKGQWDELMGIANRTDFDLTRKSPKTKRESELILIRPRTCRISILKQMNDFIRT
jgi:glycyl-tRNA synthetase